MVPTNWGTVIMESIAKATAVENDEGKNASTGIHFKHASIHIAITKGNCLTHWRQVSHKCIGNLTINDPDNGLAPTRHQAITSTNAWILVIGTFGTNFSEIFIKICIFTLKKMHFKRSSEKWMPFCFGLKALNELNHPGKKNHKYFTTLTIKWTKNKRNINYCFKVSLNNTHHTKTVIHQLLKRLCTKSAYTLLSDPWEGQPLRH